MSDDPIQAAREAAARKLRVLNVGRSRALCQRDADAAVVAFLRALAGESGAGVVNAPEIGVMRLREIAAAVERAGAGEARDE